MLREALEIAVRDPKMALHVWSLPLLMLALFGIIALVSVRVNREW